MNKNIAGGVQERCGETIESAAVFQRDRKTLVWYFDEIKVVGLTAQVPSFIMQHEPSPEARHDQLDLVIPLCPTGK